MIILRDKLFSGINLDAVLGQSDFFIRELIKIILFGDKCKQDIPHWLDNSLGSVKKIESDLNRLRYKSSVVMFYGIFDISGRLGVNKRTTEITYVKDRFNEVYNQKDKGNYKYRHLISQEDIDWNDLMIKLKYIALCISGQLNPENDNFYELYNKISDIKINFNRQYSGDIKVLLERIIHEQFYL